MRRQTSYQVCSFSFQFCIHTKKNTCGIVWSLAKTQPIAVALNNRLSQCERAERGSRDFSVSLWMNLRLMTSLSWRFLRRAERGNRFEARGTFIKMMKFKRELINWFKTQSLINLENCPCIKSLPSTAKRLKAWGLWCKNCSMLAVYLNAFMLPKKRRIKRPRKQVIKKRVGESSFANSNAKQPGQDFLWWVFFSSSFFSCLFFFRAENT